MRAGMATGGNNTSIYFRFSIEAGEERRPRDFEWRKTKEDYGIESEAKGGTRYVLTLVSGDASSAGCSSSKLSPALHPDEHRQALAVLTFPKAFTSLMHQLSLKILDRWKIDGGYRSSWQRCRSGI